MTGYNGILWEFMGIEREGADFCGFLADNNGLQQPGILSLSLWINL